jgi:hypothetical protein
VKAKRTQITVETYEVLVVKQRASLSRRWCAACNEETAAIDLQDACNSGLSREAVQRHLESGRLHLIDPTDDLPLICLNSLLQN